VIFGYLTAARGGEAGIIGVNSMKTSSVAHSGSPDLHSWDLAWLITKPFGWGLPNRCLHLKNGRPILKLTALRRLEP